MIYENEEDDTLVACLQVHYTKFGVNSCAQTLESSRSESSVTSSCFALRYALRSSNTECLKANVRDRSFKRSSPRVSSRRKRASGAPLIILMSVRLKNIDKISSGREETCRSPLARRSVVLLCVPLGSVLF